MTRLWIFLLLLEFLHCFIAIEGESRVAFACETSSLSINCERDVIKILRANYGRLKIDICNDGANTESWSLNCMSMRSIRVVADLCMNKTHCSVLASNSLFGNVCHSTPKYLEIEFECISEDERRPEPQLITSPQPPTTKPWIMKTSTTPPSTVQFLSSSEKTESTTSTTTELPTTTTTTTTKMTTTTRATTQQSMPWPTKQAQSGACEQIEVRNIVWPETPLGDEVRKDCPKDFTGDATWKCSSRSPARWLGSPDLSQCVSEDIRKLQDKYLQSDDAAAAVQLDEKARDLSNHANDTKSGGDIIVMTEMMENFLAEVDTLIETPAQYQNDQNMIVETVTDEILHAGSNLLGKQDLWMDIPVDQQGTTATKLLDQVEQTAFHAAKIQTVPRPQPVAKVEVNLLLEINVVSTEGNLVRDVQFPAPSTKKLVHDRHSAWAHSSDSITLTGNAIKELGVNGIAHVIFATYKNLEELLRPEEKLVLVDDYNNYVEEDYTYDDNYDLKDDVNKVKTYEHGFGLPDQRAKYDEHGMRINRKDQDRELNDQEEDTNIITEDGEEYYKRTRIVNSNIISASVEDHTKRVNLSEPVVYTLEHKTTDNVFNPTCSFWEYSQKTHDGKWSDFGCELVATNITHTTCSCNHLTNFAILMDVYGTSVELEGRHHIVLTLVTYVGCFISLICLFICWCTFQFFRSLQCDRNTIHKNLVICLFFAELIFLAGVHQTNHPTLCPIIAGFLHYFFLAAFAWMCLEGIQLYCMLVEVFETSSRRVYYYIAGYVVPLVIVCISAAIDKTGYGTERYCWLNIQSGFIWAFVGPVICVLTLNVIMLSIAIYTMCKHYSVSAQWRLHERSTLEKTRSWLKGASILVVLLGLTWIFGLLCMNEDSLVMAYFFTIFNSLQGVFIFLFHCLWNEKVQKEYKKLVRHSTWLPDCLRVSYGGLYTTSTAPSSQSSSGNYIQKLLRRKRSSLTSLQRTSNTPSTKWQIATSPNCEPQNIERMQQRQNASLLQSLSEPTEDPSGYLEPSSEILPNENIYASIDGLGDAPFDVDKYKIKVTPLDFLVPPQPEIWESEISDAELFRMTEKEKMLSEHEQTAHQTASEQDLVNSLSSSQDSIKGLKRRLMAMEGYAEDDAMSQSTNSLNDLNKGIHSDESLKSLNVSTPNINYRASTIKKDNRRANGENSPAESGSIDCNTSAMLGSADQALSLTQSLPTLSDDSGHPSSSDDSGHPPNLCMEDAPPPFSAHYDFNGSEQDYTESCNAGHSTFSEC